MAHPREERRQDRVKADELDLEDTEEGIQQFGLEAAEKQYAQNDDDGDDDDLNQTHDQILLWLMTKSGEPKGV
ncbi:MAG: hypothetical protein M3539_11450 [Acidobacteriota bacterium]|nr:hypothetical protein [Acidobacteriota bacterium]